MPQFTPAPGHKITIRSRTYEVMPHPVMASAAYGQEGAKAVAYQLSDSGQLFAFKVFKRGYRDPQLINTCRVLSQLALRGLDACKRDCLTPSQEATLLRTYPDLEYAVLMPWIQGSTWHNIVENKVSISESASKKLVHNTVTVLAELESRGFAHCDIAAGNVIVNTSTGEVNLIDVEDMFGPGLSLTRAFPRGTNGYHHSSSRTDQCGQWNAAGDRFAAAVLLAEMLTWHNLQIRQAAYGEQYFSDNELQDLQSSRYQLMVRTLTAIDGDIADCFVEVWRAGTLNDCPPLSRWAQLLNFSVVSEWLPIQAPPPPPPYRPVWVLILSAPYCWVTQIAINNAYILRWNPVQNAEGYIIESSDSRDFANSSQIYQGPNTSLTISGGPPKYFRICAYNTQGRGVWSNVINA